MHEGNQADADANPVVPTRPMASGNWQRIAPLRMTLIFLATGLTWIWFTDLPLFQGNIGNEPRFLVSAIKGSLFIVFCSLLIYWLARREFRLASRANSLLRAIADSTTDAVFIKDHQGKYIFCNEAAAKFVGREIYDILGNDDTILFEPKEAEIVMARDRRIMREGIAETEEEVLTSAGATRTYLAMKAPFRDEKGTIVGIIGISRDITERKRTQDAIRAKESFARGVLDAMSARVAVLNAKGTIVAVNQSWNDFSALSFDNSDNRANIGVGVNYFEVCRKSDDAGDASAAIVAEGIREVIDGRSNRFQCEYPCETPETLRWFQMSVTRLDHGTGGAVVAHTDISELKYVEEELRESEQRFREFVDHAADAFFLHDEQGVILDVNSQACRSLGYCRQELIGMSPQDFDADLTPEARAKIWHELFAGRTVAIETRLRRKDSTTFPVEVRIRPFTSGGKRFAVALCHDISARKRSEDALRSSEAQLRLFAEHVPAPIAMLDRELRYLQVSRRWLTDYRLGDKDLSGLRHYDVFPETPEHWRAAHGRCLAGATETCDEEIFRRANGSIQWVRWEVRPWYRSASEIGGIIIFSEDITERKLAQQKMREREVRFQKVFENADTGIAISDASGRLLECNPAYCKLLGYTPKELQSSSFASYIHPDDRERNLALIASLQKGEIPSFEIENRYRHKDGRSVWVHKFTALLPKDSDAPSNMMALVTDITERRAAEQSLRESEERYRKLMDVLPGAVFVHANDEIVFCNPAFVRLMGVERADALLGKSPFDIVPSDYHSLLRSRIDKMRRSHDPLPGVEMHLLRPDGRTVPVYSVATAFSGFGPHAILVACSDLTERERSIQLLRSVMDSVTDAILTIDEHGIIQSSNPGSERSFGYSEIELVGKNVKLLMPPPYNEEHDDYIANYLRTGVARMIGSGREAEGLRRDGTRFPVEITITEFQIDGERRFTGVLRDITARQRLEAELQQAQKMEAVGRLAGGVAHDFNNLLTIINGYSDMLLTKMPDPTTASEFIVAIRDAGNRAARLTQQLLAFSRKAVVEPRSLDLNEIVAQSAKLLLRLIGEDILLSVLTDPNLPRIRADSGQIDQLIMNLVVNARDAMPKGGRLTIETKPITIAPDDAKGHVDVKPGKYARLAIADTGHGMPEEVKCRIFEPFFTTKGIGKGTGLGLAVVHGVVTQCGGYVEVRTIVGEGTTFYLFFPAVAGEAETPAPPDRSPPAHGKETILLVEDEDSVRIIARRALESQGYRVLASARGTEALRLAENFAEPIDMLVTDIVMPEVGGRQLAESIKELRPNILVLYMSGYTDDSVVHHGVLEANDAFLQKPFTPQTLARKVRAILDRK
ncbi:MAG: PAS domain S-box protein [Planctomycetota bacterium]